MHNEHISGEQAVAQANFDALHSWSKRAGTVIIVDFVDAYFHIPKTLVHPAATASELYTIGTTTYPSAINLVRMHQISRVKSLKLGRTYDHAPLSKLCPRIYGLPASPENRVRTQG